jgi:hypothetical protein
MIRSYKSLIRTLTLLNRILLNRRAKTLIRTLSLPVIISKLLKIMKYKPNYNFMTFMTFKNITRRNLRTEDLAESVTFGGKCDI